ncbi:GntR family transcriptional regulator [Streptomyces sp. NPDC050625]|uniref:GntR family transcriptional regulator n=1 Tax=Streptomyces sp. NPDC050625 TaxID=3154629 RepID=UPI00341338F1
MVKNEGRWQKRERIRERLLDLVEETAVGRPIPAERQLCEELGVSRPTLRSVVDDLVRDGLLIREHGRGVFVAKAKIAQHLAQPSGMPGPRLGVGAVNGTWYSRTVDFRSVLAGPRIGRRLKLSPGEPVLRIARLRLVDDAPMCIETLHLPEALVPGLTTKDVETGSLYQLLGQRYGLLLTDAEQIIEPTVIDEAEAELLQVPLHTPALLFERVTRDAQGRAVEFTHSVYRGDRYRIHTQLALSSRPDSGQVLGGSWTAASSVPGADTLALDPYWTGQE